MKNIMIILAFSIFIYLVCKICTAIMKATKYGSLVYRVVYTTPFILLAVLWAYVIFTG